MKTVVHLYVCDCVQVKNALTLGRSLGFFHQEALLVFVELLHLSVVLLLHLIQALSVELLQRLQSKPTRGIRATQAPSASH